jgi:hypothetical protein
MQNVILKKLTCKGILRQAYLSEAQNPIPPPLSLYRMHLLHLDMSVYKCMSCTCICTFVPHQWSICQQEPVLHMYRSVYSSLCFTLTFLLNSSMCFAFEGVWPTEACASPCRICSRQVCAVPVCVRPTAAFAIPTYRRVCLQEPVLHLSMCFMRTWKYLLCSTIACVAPARVRLKERLCFPWM